MQFIINQFSLFFLFHIDCDPNLKPSTTAELDHLVNRLEKLLDRLERTVLARELNFASEALDLRQEVISNIKTSTSPPSKVVATNNCDTINSNINVSSNHNNNNSNQVIQEEITNKDKDTTITFSQKLEQRISELESNLERRLSGDSAIEESDIKLYEDFVDSIIPTVVSQIVVVEKADNSCEDKMSLNGFEDIILGYLNPFLELSKKIGGDVATQADLVKTAFE